MKKETISGLLMCFGWMCGFFVAWLISIHQFKHIPTPSYQEQTQPFCGPATLSMFAAEELNMDIEASTWNLTNEPMTAIKAAWFKQTGQTLKFVGKIKFNQPYVWVGYYNTNPHACLVYFTSTYVVLKHGLYNPWTRTNYMVTWPYEQFFSNTLAVYTTTL
jgi:hypothetical protein